MLRIISFLVVFLCLAACREERHFITDTAYRRTVEEDFEHKKQLLSGSQEDLFLIFNQPLTLEEREALEFIYAYAPLTDLATYGGDFLLKNVRQSLKVRAEMPWGKEIPEAIFRHFVLPVRGHNEGLDSSRFVFYRELRERVLSCKTMEEAALEVNHWCHEKAIYQPTNGRTCAPLTMTTTAYGRCGEESVFALAAMRSVGIPARQVYTPRWAHCDDNHAWIEVWTDGQWKYLGACEPEPRLDIAWFTAPVRRGLYIEARVFGKYKSDEEITAMNANLTAVNVTSHYTDVKKAVIRVVDSAGRPVEGASVEYKIYNYGEYYPAVTLTTDKQGISSLTVGRGDWIIWASKDGKFGYAKLSFGKDHELVVKMDKTAGDGHAVDFELVPPPENAELPAVTPEQRAANDRRMVHEDSIRNAYVSMFMTDETARYFARRYKLDEDAVSRILVASRGNHRVIADFMARLRSEKSKRGGLDLLQRISAKDLRDVTLEVLMDHMQSRMCKNADHFRRYVRNPRVSNEMLTPYKGFFKKAVSKEDAEAYKAEPMKLVAWVAQNIRVDNDCNLGGAPISPEGVWKARVADAHSRDIFFVSMARSMAIPARINGVTGKVQLIGDDGAMDVDLNHHSEEPVFMAEGIASKGKLVASYKPIRSLDNPKYYSHFTLSKQTPQGSLQLLSYDEGDADMGGGTTWSNLLKEGTALEAGDYVLVTGTRLASGAVLSKTTFFNILPEKTTEIELVMRESEDEVQVIGNFNSESLFTPLPDAGSAARQSLLQACGRGYFVVGILGVNQEPTNHALRDIASFKADLEKWGRKMVLLFPNEAKAGKFARESFPDLPSTIIYGIDTDGIAAQIDGVHSKTSRTG